MSPRGNSGPRPLRPFPPEKNPAAAADQPLPREDNDDVEDVNEEEEVDTKDFDLDDPVW